MIKSNVSYICEVSDNESQLLIDLLIENTILVKIALLLIRILFDNIKARDKLYICEGYLSLTNNPKQLNRRGKNLNKVNLQKNEWGNT